MAWRIHDSVIRGELDNRTKGVVRVSLWFHGRELPVAVELRGNACADLAGCRLAFTNPERTVALPRDLGLPDRVVGLAGDITASRKVRLPGPGGTVAKTERWGNALYLEWFTEAEGRMVIESADFQLSSSAPEWSLTPADEAQRKEQATVAFGQFLKKLDDALNRAESKTPPPDKEQWDEFDYERMLRESDARTDKYAELLDKYMDHPDRDAIVAKEMGWDEISRLEEMERRREVGEDVEDEEVFDGLSLKDLDSAADDDEADADLEPDPATEGVDWIREEDGDISHPLSLRAFNSSMALWHAAKDAGQLERGDADLEELVTEFQITGAKLAGALDSLAYGRDLEDGPFLVAYLKRALSHLHLAQAALERVAAQRLLSAEVLATTRKELFEIREEILRLMQEFRRMGGPN